MADIDVQTLQAQTELLREIRNELQASRSMQAGGGAGGGISGGSARPGHTFVAAQSMADRTLMGEWNSLGWSNAYRQSYRSTFGGDLSAMIGFSRAPETLTQDEYVGLARQSMAGRVGNAVGSLIAPGYVARTNALADEIHQNSGRFIRFGNANAGVLGAGFDFSTERSLSRQIQTMALGDLRMNGNDYRAITSLGMQSGQFDSVGSTDDFKNKVKELANATGDLTRALHMSVQEIGTAMGNMRQLGVSSVSQQRGVLMQLGGAAMVAGMSSPEMLQLAGGVGQQGLSMGLAATTTMPAAANQAAVVRSLSQAGILSPELMAMGGGAAAITQNIMQAKMGFAASNGGYLSFMGGGANGGANTFNSMLTGLSAAGAGTFEGALTMDMDRMQRMSSMSPQQLDSLMRNQFESTMRLAGINDMTSHTAQGMAFKLARGRGMDDASAMAYATSEFSVNGRRSADFARMQSIRATQMEERKVGNDMSSARTSLAGQLRGAIQNVEAGFGSLADSTMSAIDRSVFGINAGSDFERTTNAVIAGTAGGGGIDADSFNAVMAKSPSERAEMGNINELRVRRHDSHTTNAIISGVGGLALGGLAMAWNPMGWGMLAAAGVGVAAGMVGSALGYIGSTDSEDVYTGDNAKAMVETQRGIMKGNGNDAAKLIQSNAFHGAAWKELTGQMDRTKMNGEELQKISGLISRAADESKVSKQDVINGFLASGGKLGTADALLSGGTGASSAQMALIKDYLGEFNAGTSGALATPEGAAAASKFLKAKATGVEMDNATFATVSKTFGDNFDKFRSKVENDLKTTSGKAKIEEMANGFGKIGENLGTANFNRALSGAMGLAESYLSSNGLSAEDQKSARAELATTDNGSKSMLDLLQSGKVHDLAQSGKLGQVFKEAVSVEDDQGFENRSAKDIADTYHIGQTGVEKMLATPEGKKNLKKFVEASILGNNAAIEKEQGAATPMLEANILNQAANTLKQLQESLKLGSAKNGLPA